MRFIKSLQILTEQFLNTLEYAPSNINDLRMLGKQDASSPSHHLETEVSDLPQKHMHI